MKKALLTASCFLLVTALTTACGGYGTKNYNTRNYPQNQMTPTNYGTMSNQHPYYGTHGYGTYGANRMGGPGLYQSPSGMGMTSNMYGGYTGTHMGGTRTNALSTYNDHGGYNRELADRVERACSKINGVQSASAIVYQKDAIVGLQMKNGLNAKQRQSIERQAHETARTLVPNHQVKVTSDAAMTSRIKKMDGTFRQHAHSMTTGPTTVGGNLGNAANDFGMLVRDLGRTVTAPFR